MSKHGWIITRDYLDAPILSVEVIGPKNTLLSKNELLAGTPFNLFDSDNRLCYSGFTVQDSSTLNSLFSPLDDYGSAMGGATSMRILNNGKWIEV
jgi:hypothetical protein